MLIGISGAARSGKDTVGKYIIEKYNFKSYAFADPLKRAAAEMFGMDLNDFYEDDKKEVVNEFWGFSPRQIAQLLGTEGGRQLFRDDIWIKRAELAYLELPKTYNGLLITDVRFPNEAEWIKAQGGLLIHILRHTATGNVGVAHHASELGYSDDLKDLIICNDGTLEELYQKVDKMEDYFANAQR